MPDLKENYLSILADLKAKSKGVDVEIKQATKALEAKKAVYDEQAKQVQKMIKQLDKAEADTKAQ
jgi:hypothetical protein